MNINDWNTLQAIMNQANRKELKMIAEMAGKAAEERSPQSTVERYVPYKDGHLQLEYRVNPETGTRRGPYWMFRYHEGGKQRTMYVGKTNEEEAKKRIDEKRGQ
jgi:hypothetical protein